MNKPQSIHPDIPTYKELEERIKEIENDLSEQKAINGLDLAKLEKLGWHMEACEICGLSMSGKRIPPQIPEGYALVHGWNPIETAPKDGRMFVAQAFNVDTGLSAPGGRHRYTTDPWCVWYSNGEFVRWPHPFPPTHWIPIPEAINP